MRRTTLASLVGVIALQLLCCPAPLLGRERRSGPGVPKHGYFLTVLGTYRQLIQEDHAPPLCCLERDSWAVHGPEGGLRAGYRYAGVFQITLDIAYASLRSTQRPIEPITMHAMSQQLAMDYVHSASTWTLYAGATGGLNEYKGRGQVFSSGTRHEIENWRPFLGGRLGFEMPMLTDWTLGVEGHFYKNLIVEHGLVLSAFVTWWP
jgi:hypothetical protein